MVKVNNVLVKKVMDMEKENTDMGMERENTVDIDIAIDTVMEREKVTMVVMILRTKNVIIP